MNRTADAHDDTARPRFPAAGGDRFGGGDRWGGHPQRHPHRRRARRPRPGVGAPRVPDHPGRLRARCWPGCARSAQLVLVGIEGTGAYGAGLARYLQAAGVALVEVDRPDRKTRRQQGKSDPVDAEAAARAAQAGRAPGSRRPRGGQVEALRALRVARRGAVAARADAQTPDQVVDRHRPDALRAQLRGLSDRQLIAHCATRRPDRAAAGRPGHRHRARAARAGPPPPAPDRRDRPSSTR